MNPTVHKMNPLAVAAVITGVLAVAGGVAALVASWQPLPVIIAMVVGVAVILIGAHVLGRGLPADAIADDSIHSSPVRLEGALDPALSRGLWIVKWMLAIPHYLVLIPLFVALLVVTVAAGFAILFTGRYPAALFRFSVGVFRWGWRVGFYGYSAAGTDRYPPFTLAPTDYPATLEIAYAERLSNGLVLVKPWLLALPHLIILAALTGEHWGWGDPGAGVSLLGILVLVALVILLFTGVYRAGIFDLTLGVNRWSYRVMAYVVLMTDKYPPFRLDQGPTEPNN